MCSPAALRHLGGAAGVLQLAVQVARLLLEVERLALAVGLQTSKGWDPCKAVREADRHSQVLHCRMNRTCARRRVSSSSAACCWRSSSALRAASVLQTQVREESEGFLREWINKQAARAMVPQRLIGEDQYWRMRLFWSADLTRCPGPPALTSGPWRRQPRRPGGRPRRPPPRLSAQEEET